IRPNTKSPCRSCRRRRRRNGRAASVASPSATSASDQDRPPRRWTGCCPRRRGTVVDLGAGTGLATRFLVDRADNVVAVEPDERMRWVLAERVPGARAVDGRGQSIPLPDAAADVVLASTSWHWMDPLPTLAEVGRVLVPGGVLAVMWSGPDADGTFLAQARELLATQSEASDESA